MLNTGPRDARAPARPETAPTLVEVETPAAQPRGPSSPSVLGSDLVIRGGIEGAAEVQLYGRTFGDVAVERLLVGESAELEGAVDAVVVEVRGRVIGPITARQVVLMPSARVEGDITYDVLHIQEGALIEGRCTRVKSRPAATARPLKAS
jgi:cytoskeletal protein CcmA (bactofilin family)